MSNANRLRLYGTLTALAMAAVAVLITGCSGREGYGATAPSAATGLGAQHSIADDSPMGSIGINNPTDPPQFTVATQGQLHPDGSQSVAFAVRPVINATKFNIKLVRRESGGKFRELPLIGINDNGPGTLKAQRVIPQGTYDAYAQIADNGRWTAKPITFSIDAPTVVIADDDDCWWEDAGDGVFKLFFGRR